MMEDLAMQILEIIMNSIHANSHLIKVMIQELVNDNIIKVVVTDDGKGMSEATIKKVVDPFTTSRTTRKVGMGLSFMKGLTEQCNGSFDIKSKLNEGTIVEATFQRDHLDLPPMGNLGEMMMVSIQANENIDYILIYQYDEKKFIFDTKEVKEQIEGVSIIEPDILIWIRDYINEAITTAREG